MFCDQHITVTLAVAIRWHTTAYVREATGVFAVCVTLSAKRHRLCIQASDARRLLRA
jgi:hypothetical protein